MVETHENFPKGVWGGEGVVKGQRSEKRLATGLSQRASIGGERASRPREARPQHVTVARGAGRAAASLRISLPLRP